MQGYTLKEISEKIDYSYSYISKIKSKYQKEHGWFSVEELKKFALDRIQRDFGTTPKLDNKDNESLIFLEVRRHRRMKKIADRHIQDIKNLKKYILAGKTMAEAAEILYYEL